MLGWGLEFTVYRFIGSVAFSTKQACTATVSQWVETPHLKAEVWVQDLKVSSGTLEAFPLKG